MNEQGPKKLAGVVASLEEANGQLRVVLDDVVKRREAEAPVWDYERPFTAVEFDREALESLSLSSAEFAQIGENLLARLLALSKKCGK